jgi:hypothetical protein
MSTGRGIAALMGFAALMLYLDWIPEFFERTRRISFLQWLIIEHEETGYSNKQIFSSIKALGKKSEFNGKVLFADRTYKEILGGIRKKDAPIFLFLPFIWSMIIVFAFESNEEIHLFSDWILNWFK